MGLMKYRLIIILQNKILFFLINFISVQNFYFHYNRRASVHPYGLLKQSKPVWALVVWISFSHMDSPYFLYFLYFLYFPYFPYFLYFPLFHYSIIHSIIHSITQSFIHSITQSFNHSITQSFNHSIIPSFHSFHIIR